MEVVGRWRKRKVFALWILAISFVACTSKSYATPSQNNEKEQNAPVATNTVGVQTAIRTLAPIDEPTMPSTIQAIASSPTPFQTQLHLKVSNGELSAEVQEINLDPAYPTITICSDLPTVADWMPRFSARYHGREVLVPGWMLLDPDNNAAHSKNRCYLVSLSIEIFDFGVPSGEMIFSLDYLELSIPENMPQSNPQKVFGPWRFAINLSIK